MSASGFGGGRAAATGRSDDRWKGPGVKQVTAAQAIRLRIPRNRECTANAMRHIDSLSFVPTIYGKTELW